SGKDTTTQSDSFVLSFSGVQTIPLKVKLTGSDYCTAEDSIIVRADDSFYFQAIFSQDEYCIDSLISLNLQVSTPGKITYERWLFSVSDSMICPSKPSYWAFKRDGILSLSLRNEWGCQSTRSYPIKPYNTPIVNLPPFANVCENAIIEINSN